MTHKVRLSVSETRGIPPMNRDASTVKTCPSRKAFRCQKAHCTIWIRFGLKMVMVSRYRRSFGRWVDGMTGV